MLFVSIINPRLINGEQKSLQAWTEEAAIGLTSFDPLLEQDLLKKAASSKAAARALLAKLFNPEGERHEHNPS